MKRHVDSGARWRPTRVRTALALKGVAGRAGLDQPPARASSTRRVQGASTRRARPRAGAGWRRAAVPVDGDSRVPGGDYPNPAAAPKDPPRPGHASRGLAQIRGERRAPAVFHGFAVSREGNAPGRAGEPQVARALDETALECAEAHIAKEKETGALPTGTAPTWRTVCLVSQVFGAKFFPTSIREASPTVNWGFRRMHEIDAFDKSQPLKQPTLPKSPRHSLIDHA